MSILFGFNQGIEKKALELRSLPYFSGDFIKGPNGLSLTCYSQDFASELGTNSLNVEICAKMDLVTLVFKKPILKTTLKLEDFHLKKALKMHPYLNSYQDCDNLYLPSNNSYLLQAMIESINELQPYFENLKTLDTQWKEVFNVKTRMVRLNTNYDYFIEKVEYTNSSQELLSKFPQDPFKDDLDIFNDKLLKIEAEKEISISSIVSGLEEAYKWFS